MSLCDLKLACGHRTGVAPRHTGIIWRWSVVDAAPTTRDKQQHGVRCCSQVGSSPLSSRRLKQFLQKKLRLSGDLRFRIIVLDDFKHRFGTGNLEVLDEKYHIVTI